MRLSLRPYVLPFDRAVFLKGVTHTRRVGLLVRIEHGDEVGWGDCAPLPGFSVETIDAVEQQLLGLRSWVSDLEPDAGWGNPDHSLHAAIDDLGLWPAARFGLDLALLDLTARLIGKPLPALIGAAPSPTVQVNALLVGDDEGVLAEGEKKAAEGYETLKIKVGRGAVEDDVRLVRRLRLAVGPDVAIRCDANQAWSMDHAIAFAEGVLGLGVTYIEEPLQDPNFLGELWLRTGLPIALDESLLGLEPEDLESRAYAAAAVLKPTLLGGMMRTLRFAKAASRAVIPPVISAAFESGVAMRGHVALAAVTDGGAAGLDPYNLLASDVLEPRLPMKGPTVTLAELFGRHGPSIAEDIVPHR